MSDGRLGAERHFVNCAGDAMPVVTGDAEHTQIADSYKDGGQRQAENRVNHPVESRRQAPGVVAEIWRAAAQSRTVSAVRISRRLTLLISLFYRAV